MTTLPTKEIVLGGGATMTLIEIPAGTFLMGSPNGSGHDDEHPCHEVTISTPFWMGRTPVTWDQYVAVMEEDYEIKDGQGDLPFNSWRHGWLEAVRFCDRLAWLTNMQFGLPTEAEWEYACRAGTTTEYWFGDAPQALEDHAWFENNSRQRVHPVATKLPNPWGLHDMLGNVEEWCADWFGPYPRGPVTDPRGPVRGSCRVLRGGGWSSKPRECRAASRSRNGPLEGNVTIGFRVSMTP